MQYVSWLKGKHATMVQLDGTDKRANHYAGHPLQQQAYALDDPDPSSDIPTSQFFSEGNGGEMRKSYHGYPKGFAQLLESPTDFVMTPMQSALTLHASTCAPCFLPPLSFCPS
eukprot:SAG31_NODE_646_length_13223_cov_14.088845_3_plen_113_part_00